MERVSEYATRALRMPEQADLSTIDASMDGGVLIVKVPRNSQRSPERAVLSSRESILTASHKQRNKPHRLIIVSKEWY